MPQDPKSKVAHLTARRVQQMIRQGSLAAEPDSSRRPGPTALELEILESLHRRGKTHISLWAIREELD